MIIGGAYQGKLAYAKETFPDVRWTDGEQCEKEAIFQYRGIFHFHKYIERLLSEGEDISELAKQLKETRDYDAKIAHLALARIGIDLDDGVKVNYEKVQTGPDGKKLAILTALK